MIGSLFGYVLSGMPSPTPNLGTTRFIIDVLHLSLEIRLPDSAPKDGPDDGHGQRVLSKVALTWGRTGYLTFYGEL